MCADCHETVAELTLNSRARFRAYLNSPGFSDEPGLFSFTPSIGVGFGRHPRLHVTIVQHCA